MTKTPEGHAFLNVGCGNQFSPDWTNLDLTRKRGVIHWDLRKPLPFPDNSFDAVYSSHVLEHFSPDDGRSLIVQMERVLKPGGICRIVVPDLENICRVYLEQLSQSWTQDTKTNYLNYQWMVLELLDQLVRDRPGGLIRQTLDAGAFDAEFIRHRTGRMYEVYQDSSKGAARRGGALRRARKRLTAALRERFSSPPDPRFTGEAHKWMYDRVSLRKVTRDCGFDRFEIKSFNESSIPCWDRYNLDRDSNGDGPRKPDSMFIECQKPIGRS